MNQAKKIALDLSVEFIYIDDGSNDHGYESIRKNIEKYKNIKLLKLKKNYGPGIARNLGIKIAKGKYLIFLDSDDSLINSGFKNLIKKINKKFDYDVIFFDYVKKNSKQVNLSKIKLRKNLLIKKFLRTELDMGPNFYLYKKNFINKNKIFFKDRYYEDILFILKVFTKMKRFCQFKYKIYKKNKLKNSITNTYSLKHIKDFNKSCLDKKKYFYLNVLNKIKDVNSKDLQYGLRGDYVFANKILKNCKLPLKKVEMIDIFFKKIISKKFIALTTYDKIVKKKLFKNHLKF